MRNPLPGPLLPFSLMLIVMLGIWMGIAGPLDLNLKELREWQTLLAAVIALIAAGITYRAAIAKVDFDRENAEREVITRKLSVYLRLEFVLKTLAAETRRVDAQLKPALLNRTISQDEVRLAEPPEIGEAWDFLEVFPPRTIPELI